RWVQVTMTGFVVTDPEGRTTFLDDQVLALSSSTRVTPAGHTRRRVRLDVAGPEGPAALDCKYTVPLDQQDPLAPFVERIVRAQAIRLRDNLAGGASLAGHGWWLDAAGLHDRSGTCQPLDTITHVGFHDKHLCLWRDHEEHPFARYPETGPNIHTLA